MGTNVGSLNATLSLSAFEFQNGLKQSETAAMQFAETTEVASKKAAASLGGIANGSAIRGGARALQQVGFGIQDFSSQLETRGIGGAISAVSNNVQMLGAAFGPVGLAVSAVGGALAGILLPKLLESTGWFGKSKEALSEYRKELDDFYGAFRDQSAEKESFIGQPPEALEKELSKKRKLYAQYNSEVIALNATQAQMEAAGETEMANEAYKKALATAKQRDKVQTEGKALAAARPEIEAANAERERKKESAAREKEYLASIKTGHDELNKLKTSGLEKYGTESEKLASKQLREMDELKSKTKDLSGTEKDQAISAMMAQQEVEKQKLSIKEEKDRLNEMGTAAKGSAGVDRASAEGVQAINRAMSGTRSEQDVAKMSLKTQEASLKKLEEIARKSAQTIMVQLSS